MILKFETQDFQTQDGGYIYHEVDEVITKNEYVTYKDVEGTAFCYVDPEDFPKCKLIHFRLKDGKLKSAYFRTAYLLNNDGDTINII